MNGDRYPDVISESLIQYTKPQGGLSSLKRGHRIGGHYYDETAVSGSGLSFGASFSRAKKIAANSVLKSSHEIKGTAGINGSHGQNTDKSEYIWQDINGGN